MIGKTKQQPAAGGAFQSHSAHMILLHYPHNNRAIDGFDRNPS